MDHLNDPPSAENERRFEDVIARYLDDVTAGTPDPAQLVAAHPELAHDLREFLNDHLRIMKLADLFPPSGDHVKEGACNSTPHDSNDQETAFQENLVAPS